MRTECTCPNLTVTDEVGCVREAVRYMANHYFDKEEVWHKTVRAFAEKWRAVAPELHGQRLVETYLQIFPALEDEGDTDSWGGMQSRLMLTNLVMLFPANDHQRWEAMREALDVEWDTDSDVV